MKDVAVDLIVQRVLPPGTSWGSISATLGLSHGGTGYVKALTPLQVLYIDHATLAKVPVEHPELHPSYVRVRVWALQRRLLAGMMRVAAIRAMSQSAEQKRGGDNGQRKVTRAPTQLISQDEKAAAAAAEARHYGQMARALPAPPWSFARIAGVAGADDDDGMSSRGEGLASGSSLAGTLDENRLVERLSRLIDLKL